MRYRDMHSMAHGGCHDCAPKGWRMVPKLSGDYDLDATIGHSKNSDMAKRLKQYMTHSGYGPRTAYDPYGAGDD